MNRRLLTALVLLLLLTRCGVQKEMVVAEKMPELPGLEGFLQNCVPADTVETILITKANALITADEERYEAQLTVYVVKDSMIYLSAQNKGFEILRGAILQDSIRIIDRMNRIVYRSPIKKKYGFSHPVVFEDVQKLLSPYFLCGELEKAVEADFSHILFNYDEPFIKKEIYYDRESLKMEKFEFYHAKTNKYLMGEREENGFKIMTNLVQSAFEIVASGGDIVYNRRISVKLEVNKKRYSEVDI
jgi:hypothetical protein